MGQELFIELLNTVLQRPAIKCVRRSPFPPLAAGSRRPASNSVNDRKQNTLSNLSPAKPPSSASHIPLHIGLDRNPENLSALSRIPIPKGERGEKFTPAPLARPVGVPYPPQPGQNSPVDTRTWYERHKEFSDYNKVLERRRILARSYLRPYFQEWKRVDHWKGKSFVSNEKLFKAEKALYFPNLWGQTLSTDGDGPNGGRDTTPILQGKISVVGIQSGRWAEEQVDTFLSKKNNPQLQEMIANSGGLIQRIDINAQSGWAQTILVKLFKSRIRSMLPEEQWRRYFIVKLARDTRRGLTEVVRDAMGFLNSHVGYVYLVDPQCRIRWAGSGHAWEGEIAYLNTGVKRLLGQARQPPTSERSHTAPFEQRRNLIREE